MPLITVVLPVCNDVLSLGTSLPSLFRQVFKDIEVLAVDEGSDDGSLELLRHYERAGRLRLLRHHGSRVDKLAACNDAAQRARGAWLMFFDPHDLLLFDHLSRMAEAISQHPDIELFASAYQRMEQQGPVRIAISARGVMNRRNALAAYARCEFIQPHATCIRRERFLMLGGFSEPYRHGGETHFWLGALCALPAIHYDDTVTSLRLADNGVLEPDKESLSLPTVVDLLERLSPQLSARERRQLRAAVNRVLLDWAMYKKRHGHSAHAELAALRLMSLPVHLWSRAALLMLPSAWYQRLQNKQ